MVAYPASFFRRVRSFRGSNIYFYYGAADTTSCLATFKLKDLLEELVFVVGRQLMRFEGNPIIAPIAEHPWESQATFNPGAIYERGESASFLSGDVQ